MLTPLLYHKYNFIDRDGTEKRTCADRIMW